MVESDDPKQEKTSTSIEGRTLIPTWQHPDDVHEVRYRQGELISKEKSLIAIIIRTVPGEKEGTVQHQLLVKSNSGVTSLPSTEVPFYRDNQPGMALDNNKKFFNKKIGISPAEPIKDWPEALPDKSRRTVYYLAKEKLSDVIGDYEWIPLEQGRHLLPQTDPDFLRKITTDWRDDQ